MSKGFEQPRLIGARNPWQRLKHAFGVENSNEVTFPGESAGQILIYRVFDDAGTPRMCVACRERSRVRLAWMDLRNVPAVGAWLRAQSLATDNPVRDRQVLWCTRRGFVDHIRIACAWWADGAHRWYDHSAITEVALVAAPPISGYAAAHDSSDSRDWYRIGDKTVDAGLIPDFYHLRSSEAFAWLCRLAWPDLKFMV